MKNHEDLQFKIDQLRKDKIIYAVEACATSLACFLIYLFSVDNLRGNLRYTVNQILVIIAVVYTIYMGIGNYFRLRKIKQLEKELKG